MDRRADNPTKAGAPDWPRVAAPEFPVQELGDSVMAVATPEPLLCGAFDTDRNGIALD